MSSTLALNCWVLGERPDFVFTVKIPRVENVSALKEAIKEGNQQAFRDVDARSLSLWKVKIDLDKDLDSLDGLSVEGGVQGGEKLKGWSKLLKVFANEVDDGHLHIVVQTPPEVATPPLTHAPPSTLEYDHLTQARMDWTKRFPAKAPSQTGTAKNFAVDQAKTPPAFRFERPPSATATIPITLLHPVFGQFQEDCESYVPTKHDHKFALEFSVAMSQFYKNEDGRALEIRKLFKAYGLPFEATSIDRYKTDGDIRWEGFVYSLLEIKPDIGCSPGAEPLFQAVWYYTAIMRYKLRENPNTPLPCLILYAFGSHIGFAGAVWTKVPQLQVLAPTLPMFYHSTDVDMRMRAARYFGSMKKATLALQDYYTRQLSDIKALEPAHQPDPTFPHPTQYRSLVDGATHTFTYSSHLDKEKLIFRAREDQVDIFVKFVRRYSKAAHLEGASKGFAPQLRGFETVPGGWYMVIMDYIDDTFEELDDSQNKAPFAKEIRDQVISLHQAGYVHGDIRATNVMVKKNGESGIMLVDFDWSGVIGQVCYPMNINTQGIPRPWGAYDGEVIMADHDIQMIDFIFVPPIEPLNNSPPPSGQT